MQSTTQTVFDVGAAQLSLRDLLTIVFKRRILILSVALTAVAITVGVSLTMPRTYQVTATLLVNRARAEVPIGPTESGQVFVDRVSEQDLNSEIEILKSREMIEDVLTVLKIDESPQPERSKLTSLRRTVGILLGGHQLSGFEAMVVDLQENIRISPVRRSNLIQIAYESSDPKWATTIVKTLTERYLDRRAERSQSSQAVSFFAEQMQNAETRLRDTEKALESYVDKSSITIVSGEEDTDALMAQKSALMDRLAVLEADLGNAEINLESRIKEAASLSEQLQREPERIVSPNRQNQDATSEEIERALATLQLERDGLLQDFKPDSRFVRDIDMRIQLAEERLEEAKKSAAFGGTEANPVFSQIRSELSRVETEIEGTRAKIVLLREQLAENRTQLKNLNEKTFELENLVRSTRAAEEDYLLYRKKHEEARISAAMDQEKFINVAISQPARMPLRPVPRHLFQRFLFALVVGVLGGLGLAIGGDLLLNRSFTTGEDIERRLGIPHLASIPDSARMG